MFGPSEGSTNNNVSVSLSTVILHLSLHFLSSLHFKLFHKRSRYDNPGPPWSVIQLWESVWTNIVRHATTSTTVSEPENRSDSFLIDSSLKRSFLILFMNDFSMESLNLKLPPLHHISAENLLKRFHMSRDTTDDLQSANEGKC